MTDRDRIWYNHGKRKPDTIKANLLKSKDAKLQGLMSADDDSLAADRPRTDDLGETGCSV